MFSTLKEQLCAFVVHLVFVAVVFLVVGVAVWAVGLL